MMNPVVRTMSNTAVGLKISHYVFALPRISQSFILSVALLVAILVSAFSIIYYQDLHRCLLVQSRKLAEVNHRLQIEKGQLLLEDSALSSQTNIQQLAESHLKMHIATSADTVTLYIRKTMK